MTIKRGDLVRNDQDMHEYGIVTKVINNQATLLMGDGLTYIVADDGNFKAVPYYDGATIPASFPELVDAYEAICQARGATSWKRWR